MYLCHECADFRVHSRPVTYKTTNRWSWGGTGQSTHPLVVMDRHIHSHAGTHTQFRGLHTCELPCTHNPCTHNPCTHSEPGHTCTCKGIYTSIQEFTHMQIQRAAGSSTHACAILVWGCCSQGGAACPSQVSYPDAAIHPHPHALGSPSVQGRAFVSPWQSLRLCLADKWGTKEAAPRIMATEIAHAQHCASPGLE